MTGQPTIVDATEWVAACHPDGQHLTFQEAVDALRAHGVQFDPAELECEILVGNDGLFTIAQATDKGIVGWVLHR